MWYRRRNNKEHIMIFKWQEKVSSSVSLAGRNFAWKWKRIFNYGSMDYFRVFMIE